jgi:hypothetical protein
MSHSRHHHNPRHEEPGSSPIPGRPGYRIRNGRSGLDPIDTGMEAAYEDGLFLRNLFTGRIRTRNPFLVASMMLIGACLLMPLLLTTIDTLGLGYLSRTIACSAPFAIVGLAFLVNAALNLRLANKVK